ncbi:cytochrome P450 [Actinosynnema sp. NPDC047251]|uniref:Putative cytochrome P450 n=1 Tax=Saccharothrix espanaensis (strain ATCC 51144 / DSM 44229 / JCM 9112 / NBRC 15066 / NRRL 15764) TaxID=1179773 RepID=K0K296_SACES|nr:cytochrome P450 [Saccharothrix espanaensis]CCH30658.1 putative cytochrome P450 [Saccharothrix espanaensis DSM 44229]
MNHVIPHHRDRQPVVDLRAYGDRLVTDPYSVYSELLAQGPIHLTILPTGLPAWLVLGHPEAKTVLVHPDLAYDATYATDQWRTLYYGAPDATQPFQGRSMLTSDPPDHERLRKPVAHRFVPSRIDDMRGVVENLTARLLDTLPTGEAFDLVRQFAAPLTLGVLCDLLGIRGLDHTFIQDWVERINVPRSPEDTLAARREIVPFVDKLIEEAKLTASDSLLGNVLHGDGATSMTHEELRGMVVVLLNAGHETTTTLITTAIWGLLTNPDQMALLRENPDLLDGTIDETLRYGSPVHIAPSRFARRELTVAGTVIPADGTQVQVVIGAAHRDPRVFPDPHVFDIRRPANELLAFGRGIHFCLGWALGRLEAAIAIPALLDRFPGLALAGDPADLRWRAGRVVRCLDSLPLDAGSGRHHR